MKAYRVFNLKTKKVQLSRDVRFDEKLIWNWEKQIVEDAEPDLDGGAAGIDEEDGSENDEVAELESDESGGIPVRGTRTLQDVYQRCSMAVTEPVDSMEALSIDVWKKAMHLELSLIEKNNTWKLADLPQGKKAIGVKWVFRTKLNPDGSICKYKARLVVKGYIQSYGIDYTETFAPVSRLDTIRLLFALFAHRGWEIHQMDV